MEGGPKQPQVLGTKTITLLINHWNKSWVPILQVPVMNGITINPYK